LRIATEADIEDYETVSGKKLKKETIRHRLHGDTHGSGVYMGDDE